MKLSSLETTPNPNCMKLNLDEQIVETPISLQRGKESNLPTAVKQLLDIEGVREAFLASNFITLTRQGNADWQPILSAAARLLGLAAQADPNLLKRAEASQSTTPAGTRKELGEVEIAALVFRSLPVQVRVLGADAQARVSLSDRFNEALQQVLKATGANYIQERHWEPYPPRHGQPEVVAQMVAEEIGSLIDEEELARLVQAAITDTNLDPQPKQVKPEALLVRLSSGDWQTRLRAIQQLEVTAETFPALVRSLQDEKAVIRRWAAALLGTSERSEAVAPLARALLNDSSVIVRRTAGDALSDLGNEQAIPTMCQVLEDRSQLVRWRAARFLTEMGDESAIEALQRAIERESEFDVGLEMKAALERIEGGGERQLPMWMRLSQSNGA